MSAYCTTNDLLLGDITISSAIDLNKVVRDAADEMDSKIGFVYELPLPASLPQHITTMLKMINARLASGRLILTIASPAEAVDLYRYGTHLIELAEEALCGITTGKFQIPGATQIEDLTPGGGAIINHDAESAIDVFESQFMRRSFTQNFWVPGESL
jgi:hypothetical protein